MKRIVFFSALALSFIFSFGPSISAENENIEIGQDVSSEIIIGQHKIDMTQGFSISKSKFKLGEQGVVTPEKIHGVIPKGTFKEIKNTEIELESDGSFTVLKTGKIKIHPEFVLSEESSNEIKEAYIKKNNIHDVNIGDLIEVVKDNYFYFELEVEEGKKISIDVTPHFTIDKTDLMIGETAKLKIDPINGVDVTGEFILSNESALFNVDANGVVIPKQVGNKLMLFPSFNISEESFQEIFEVKKKELKDESLTIDDIEFYHKDIQQLFYLNVSPFILAFVPKFHLEKTIINVGEKTRMIVEPMYGVDMTGYIDPYRDEIIEIAADGSITGLKAGKTRVLRPTFQSKEIQNKVISTYIEKEGIINVPLEGVALTTPDNLVFENIEVVDSNEGGIGGNNKKYEPVKTLPQTGESKGVLLILLGSLTTVGSAFFLRSRLK